jgi:hypothetical protein
MWPKVPRFREVTMPVPIQEVYKQIFEAHRHASEFRLRILTVWGVVYATLSAVFVWTQSAMKPLSWTVTLLGVAFTLLLWMGDARNRPAIHRSKEVGAEIERDPTSEIPENQRFFSGLEKGVSHSRAIDVFGAIMLLLLGVATVYLLCSRGQLPA